MMRMIKCFYDNEVSSSKIVGPRLSVSRIERALRERADPG